MTNLAQFAEDLSAHATLCEELLLVAESESRGSRSEQAESAQLTERRKALLPRLQHTVSRLRAHRESWLRLEPSLRAQSTAINAALRRNQQLVMKIVALERDNEQARLRRAFPANAPTVAQTNICSPGGGEKAPRICRHFVAELYRRNVNV